MALSLSSFLNFSRIISILKSVVESVKNVTGKNNTALGSFYNNHLFVCAVYYLALDMDFYGKLIGNWKIFNKILVLLRV